MSKAWLWMRLTFEGNQDGASRRLEESEDGGLLATECKKEYCAKAQWSTPCPFFELFRPHYYLASGGRTLVRFPYEARNMIDM